MPLTVYVSRPHGSRCQTCWFPLASTRFLTVSTTPLMTTVLVLSETHFWCGCEGAVASLRSSKSESCEKVCGIGGRPKGNAKDGSGIGTGANGSKWFGGRRPERGCIKGGWKKSSSSSLKLRSLNIDSKSANGSEKTKTGRGRPPPKGPKDASSNGSMRRG